MRDLTPELKERLNDIDGRAASLRAQLKELEKEAELTRGLLEIEMRRQGRVGPTRAGPSLSIGEVVAEALLQGEATKDDLKTAAEAAGHDSPGRAIHAVLMGLQRHGHALRSSDEHYYLTARGRQAAKPEE